ncbi:MAG: hypothetical protein Phog2KO_50580 [Phototrophicaceae bacterium]
MTYSKHISTNLGMLYIRQATASDIDNIQAILINISDWLSEQNTNQWILGGHDRDRMYVEQIIKRGTGYVVEKNDQVIAIVQLSPPLPFYWDTVTDKAENFGYVATLSVHRSFAKNGIGEALLNWSEQVMKADGKTVAYLDCYGGNTKLCTYYESKNYRLIHKVKSYTDYYSHLYQKTL